MTIDKTDNKTLLKLVRWIDSLKALADADESFDISWFDKNNSAGDPFVIVGGWSDGFADYDTILYTSKSNPSYAMCVKIAVNEAPYAYVDFDSINMPYDELTGIVDDTCVALERSKDDSIILARFYLEELERITKYFDLEDQDEIDEDEEL